KVCKVGSGESCGALRQHVEVYVGSEGLALRVYGEDLFAPLAVRTVDDDASVEAARAQKRRVEDVGAVCGRDEDDRGVDIEAVHLDEQLVERLLALIVTAAESGSTLTSHRIDLIDEDDGRGGRLRLLEEVADAARADTDEHLHEVRTGDRVEGHGGLSRD